MLPRNQSQPSRKFPAVAKCFAVGDGRDYGGRNQRAYTFHLCNLLASFFSLEGLLDALLHGLDAFIHAAELCVQRSKKLLRKRCQLRMRFACQLHQLLSHMTQMQRDNDAVLRKQTANLVA